MTPKIPLIPYNHVPHQNNNNIVMADYAGAFPPILFFFRGMNAAMSFTRNQKTYHSTGGAFRNVKNNFQLRQWFNLVLNFLHV